MMKGCLHPGKTPQTVPLSPEDRSVVMKEAMSVQLQGDLNSADTYRREIREYFDVKGACLLVHLLRRRSEITDPSILC